MITSLLLGRWEQTYRCTQRPIRDFKSTKSTIRN